MPTSECTTVLPNSDVLGIGIRINFYCTMLLLTYIPRSPYTVELLCALYANTGITGLGLLLTAIIQTIQEQLSLFHAIFIWHMVSFLGIAAAPIGKYRWTRGRGVLSMYVELASLIACVGWCSYLWIHVKDYGSQPECNDKIKVVVMFFTVRATVPWLRRLMIATLAFPIVAAGLMGLMAMLSLPAVIRFAMQRSEEEEEAEETNLVPAGLTCSFTLGLSAIYSIVMLELTVHRNTAKLLPNGTNIAHGVVQVDNSWAFGQVLSVVMIIANLKEVVHFLLGG